ncbi:hypothetical protein RRG08_055959 [Elysia crispata]|uniref:N-acetyltransferase domain-containing protein n=1 Tax=Elysia crispata TaxID=231223 RepID=A0AAE1AHB7_9GAST|nr:hypothetical protein RRG08_055959 [Elysia crispata]
MSEDYKVLPVHQNIHLQDECSEILNQQWPRSKAARNHSISKSTDTLPVSLAFVKHLENMSNEVLGFSKISAVQGIKDAGLVESVVLREEDRGKGLGRVLMNLTEEYGHRLGIRIMYLSTKDKEGFYSHLGYEKCQPVLSLGQNAHRVPESMLHHFMAASVSSSSQSGNSQILHKSKNAEASKTKKSEIDYVVSELSSVKISQDSASSHSHLPPPPLPPPLPSTVVKSNISQSQQITRLDPNCVTWMKKNL